MCLLQGACTACPTEDGVGADAALPPEGRPQPLDDAVRTRQSQEGGDDQAPVRDAFAAARAAHLEAITERSEAPRQIDGERGILLDSIPN